MVDDRRLKRLLVVCACLTTLFLSLAQTQSLSQGSFPDPPTDLTRVYYLNPDQQLRPFPFEAGSLSLNVFVPAAEDKITRVQLTGARSETVLDGDNLKFYVFVGEKMDPPPHQLVRLAGTKSRRELKISVIKGRKGYAPFADDTIRLEHRVLERLRVSVGPGRFIFVNYMQLTPINPLTPGEYAIIGDSLADMATFRVK
jgi:hypothetical protein